MKDAQKPDNVSYNDAFRCERTRRNLSPSEGRKRPGSRICR